MKPIGRAAGRRTAAAWVLGVLLTLATACSGGGRSGGGPTAAGGARTGDTVASAALVTIAPADGAADVATTGTLKVAATGGRLSSVTVRDDQGGPVPGAITSDGAGWAPAGHLDTATQYTVDAVAVDPAGRESDKHSTFTTVTPKDTFVGFSTPEDGSTVGVGMEVHLAFNRPIRDKKAVEAAVRVTSAPAVAVAPHWYGDQQLYIRPQDFWPAGTEVTLRLDLEGVEGAPGVYGNQRKDVHFTVGRRQVSEVDAAAHTMTVYRDDKAIRTLPVSAGSADHTTYNGTMVISEKYVSTRMDGDTVGFGGEYDIKDVPHAMRLTDSGTYIYGNYWAPPEVFGRTDTSHGCVGLQDVRGAGDPATAAAWFYTHSIVGDVVRVVRSKDETVQWYNGLNGWNLPWSAWTA